MKAVFLGDMANGNLSPILEPNHKYIPHLKRKGFWLVTGLDEKEPEREDFLESHGNGWVSVLCKNAKVELVKDSKGLKAIKVGDDEIKLTESWINSPNSKLRYLKGGLARV